MQQVHITAGALILLGGILFITTGSPLYVLISMAVGLGLFIAGATGFCGMARILSYMPRNK